MREVQTPSFNQLVSTNKRNSEVLSETMITISLSPTVPQAPIFSNTDCNNLLQKFLDKVADITATTPPISNQKSEFIFS